MNTIAKFALFLVVTNVLVYLLVANGVIYVSNDLLIAKIWYTSILIAGAGLSYIILKVRNKQKKESFSHRSN